MLMMLFLLKTRSVNSWKFEVKFHAEHFVSFRDYICCTFTSGLENTSLTFEVSTSDCLIVSPSNCVFSGFEAIIYWCICKRHLVYKNWCIEVIIIGAQLNDHGLIIQPQLYSYMINYQSWIDQWINNVNQSYNIFKSQNQFYIFDNKYL